MTTTTTTTNSRGRSIIDHLSGSVETTTKHLVNLVVIGGLLLLLCSVSIGGRGSDDKGNGIDGRYDNNKSFSIVVTTATAFTTTTKTTKRFLHSPNNNEKISHHWLDLAEERRTQPSRTVTRTSSSSSSLSSSSSSSSESRRRNLTANSGDKISPTTTNGVDMVAMRANNNNNNDDDDDCLVEERPMKHVARERQPPFPSSAYSDVQEEEEGLTYNYISFIDQSILKTYSQQTRLIEPRRYALPEQFETKNANVEPTIDDVAMPQTNYGPVARLFAWNGLPARTVVGSASYLVFPYIIELLDTSTELSKLVDSFLPGISIVLGTYFSLTISILYDRQTRLTEAVNLECSQLALTLINLLHLFENTDEDAAVEGAQCVADQVRVLVHDNRGRETMGVVYSDPYARLLRLLKDYSNTDICTSLVNDAYLLADLHGNVGRLFQLRTDRLTVESLALAPTHFDVMTFLCGLLLAGFALGTVATATQDGVPSETAQVLFAGLVVCYTIFYEMAFDLNRPFDGIYQIRRSGAAMHLLQIKQIVTTHPVLKDRVDFEAIGEDDGEAGECDGDCQRRKARIWYN